LSAAFVVALVAHFRFGENHHLGCHVATPVTFKMALVVVPGALLAGMSIWRLARI
jgi:hypothetical protein